MYIRIGTCVLLFPNTYANFCPFTLRPPSSPSHTLPFRIPFYPFLNAYRALSEILDLKKVSLYSMKDFAHALALSLSHSLALSYILFFLLLSTFYILHVKSIKSTMLTRWEMNGAQKKSYMLQKHYTRKKTSHTYQVWVGVRTKERKRVYKGTREQWQNVNIKKAYSHTRTHRRSQICTNTHTHPQIYITGLGGI